MGLMAGAYCIIWLTAPHLVPLADILCSVMSVGDYLLGSLSVYLLGSPVRDYLLGSPEIYLLGSHPLFSYGHTLP